jgi:hypothetical protein
LARGARAVYRRRMETERRSAPRSPASIYFNKYIDGQPHLCEAIELSATGMLVRKVHEPEGSRACYAIEIAPGSEGCGVWLCATPVWSSGPFEALGFVGQSPADRERIEALIAGL